MKLLAQVAGNSAQYLRVVVNSQDDRLFHKSKLARNTTSNVQNNSRWVPSS
jgi:hypothetical protein